MNMRTREKGAISGPIIAIVALVILVILFGGFSIWSYMNYVEQKTDVDGKINEAQAKAVLEQQKADEEKFAAREKEPMRQFVGPADYGRLTFEYPKTWSAFQATDISKGGGAKYEAYLNPILVPPVTLDQKYALRVTIEQVTYDAALKLFESKIKTGKLKSSAFSSGSLSGTKLEGNFTDATVGTAVLVKMRDRTLTLRTDGDVFKADYEKILTTVKFNE